jgi:uncharacterized repeat protein (TIGR01451 family)
MKKLSPKISYFFSPAFLVLAWTSLLHYGSQDDSRRSRDVGRKEARFLSLALLLLTISLHAPAAVAAQPTGYQEYYVLGYEEHVWRTFREIYGGPDGRIPGTICSTVSLVASADDQVIYYDHWEDGYEADLLNPFQPTTEVYGDSDVINGGQGNDILRAGDPVILASDQASEGPEEIRGYVLVDPRRNPDDIRYDGGDRIITIGGPVALTHAMWPLGESWVGGAWEIYSRQVYEDAFSYRLPVGVDLYELSGGNTSAYGDFRYVFLQLQAFEDNTIVTIDNGVNAVNVALDRGETYLSTGYLNSISAPAIAIYAGTQVRSDKPVQVGLVTGADRPEEEGLQARFFVVPSDRLWGADYVVPLPSGGEINEAEIYLVNPNDFSITVNAFDAVAQSTFVVNPSQYITATVPYSLNRGNAPKIPQDTAVRFSSSDGVFGVLVAVDSSHPYYDWGFSGIPTKYLSRDYHVSWAPGSADLSNNGSPIWVTPVADDTVFHVDFSPLDGIVDQAFQLDVLEQRRVFDPDNDNTGTHVWATSPFAMAWGEDPQTAGLTSPYLDLGLAIVPLLEPGLDSVLTLNKTASPTILPPAGGTVTFTLVAQSGRMPVSDVMISDTLPVNWSYVPDSTVVTYPDGRPRSLAPAHTGESLFWNLSAGLDVNQSLTLTFQAQVTETGGVGLGACDGFESFDYSGGLGWASPWEEQGDDGSPDAGQIRIVSSEGPFAGGYHLQMRSAGRSIVRTVDLSQYVAPTLQFARRVCDLEPGDRFYLEVHDGLRWTAVSTWGNGDLEGLYVYETVDLTPYAGAATSIRFRSDANVSIDDFLYVDQIKVYEGLGTSVNRGEASGLDEYSSRPLNSGDEATVYVSPVSLVKSVSSSQAEVGDTLVYTLTYSNDSSSAVYSAVLRDVLPIESISFQSASNGGVYSAVSGSVLWALGTLAPGANGTVTFSAKINSFVDDGTVLKNVGFLESAQARAASNEVRTTVNAPDVEFSKSGPSSVFRGQVISYTLTYQNVGGKDATGTVIWDDVPSSTVYVPDSLAINTGSGWVALSDAVDDDQGAFVSPKLVISPGVDAGTIAPGESGRVRFSVWIPDGPPATALILNTAVLDRDLDIPRESNTVATYASNLRLRKVAEQEVVGPGDEISYALGYKNISSLAAQTNVYVIEPVPSFTRFIPGTAYGGDCVEYSWDDGASWGITVPVTPVTHLRWFDGSLPQRTERWVGFAVQVDTTLPPNTTVRNVARAISNEAAVPGIDWIRSNEVSVRTVDLWVQKHVNESSAAAGDAISYTIHYGNHGSADASGVWIEDNLPAGTSYVPGSIWGAGADDSGDPTLTWNVGVVMAGAKPDAVVFAAAVDTDLHPGTVVTNTATLGSPYGVANSVAVTTIITCTVPPILSLDKRANARFVVPGQQLTYTLRIVNDGGTAHRLVVSDVVPAHTSFVSCSGAECRMVDDEIMWGPLDLPGAGKTLELALVVAIDEGLRDGWTIVNADYRLAAQNAPLLAGLPVTTTVRVAELSLLKWAFRDEVFAGSRLGYGILVGNTGSGASNLVVSDTLPTHTKFAGCDCTIAGVESATDSAVDGRGVCGAPFTCGMEGNTLVWRVDEIAARHSLQMTFWVTVEAGLSEGTSVINEGYAVAADCAPPVMGSPPVTTTVRELRLSISKAAWPDPVRLGQELLFTITLRNEGSLVQDLTVTDLLPSGVSFTSCEGALCELSDAGQPEVIWWLPSLSAGDERELFMRVIPERVDDDRLVNASYSVWVPAAARRVWGMPVEVAVLGPFKYCFYLPVLSTSPIP